MVAAMATNAARAQYMPHVYINPGHGGHDSDDRNVVIYPFAAGDTAGYWESNSNLKKGFALNNCLRAKGYTTSMTPIPEFIADSNIRVNKLSYTNMHIPIEFRYRHKCGFKIAVGVRVGLTVDLHSKYFGPALNGSEDKDLIKDYKIVNRTKVPVEVTFRTGWKFVGVSVSYMVTKLFEAEKGPQICPLSVGISLSPY